MSRVLNTVVELIRLEDKLELLHMNFISLQICFVVTRRVLPHSYLNSPDECGKTRLVIRNKFVVK